MISIIFGILIYFKTINASPGVLDISQYKSSRFFSVPTKIGEVFFYKYSCDDAGFYTNVFDGNFKLFPTRSHTRLVNLVLVVKNDEIKLIQLMYTDVMNDYRLNNLFYRKNEGSWEKVDSLKYKSYLSTLKNNYVVFDINKPENQGFKKLNLIETYGYNSYIPMEGYELDKVYYDNTLVWQPQPYYDFKSLDITETSEGPDRIRFNYSNYFSEVSEYYKKKSGMWNFDVSQREVDLLSLSTHGWIRKKILNKKSLSDQTDKEFEKNLESMKQEEQDQQQEEYDPDKILFLDENEYFNKKLITFKVSDLCDLDNGSPLKNLYFNLNFDKKDIHDLTVIHYETYDITSYEFTNLLGCRLDSVKDQDNLLFEFNRGSGKYFHDLKLSYVSDFPVLLVSVTYLEKVHNACDSVTNTCKETPFLYKYYFFKKTNEVWYCLETQSYYTELNNLLQYASTITIKKLYESRPETKTLIPSTPNLDYGGKEPFTYDINNPFELKFKQDILFTDPDLIRLYVKPQYVLNVIVDGTNILWEQKENGSGCLIIYIYKSDNELLSHLVIDSKIETHLFFRYTGKKWLKTTKEDYEKSKKFYKGLKYIFNKSKSPIDEYIIPNELIDNNITDINNDILSSLDLNNDAINYIKSATKSNDN